MVLRLDSRETDWVAAAREQADTPEAVAALLKGRSRIECGPDEAAAALAWAERLAGWTDDSVPPLHAYPRSGDQLLR